MFRSGRFRVAPVGPGVRAAVALPSSGASANCGLVDLGTKTLVFDSMLTPPAAKDLRAAAPLLTGKDASQVVDRHCHPDQRSTTVSSGALSSTTPRSSSPVTP